MTTDDVAAAADTYAAVLSGGSEQVVSGVLAQYGIELESLLLEEDQGKDDITRSDLTELITAASMLAYDGADLDSMHMPNVPKMSRRKSDSGIDVFDVHLDENADADDLGASDRLTIASVKHTVSDSTGNVRWALVHSTTTELTVAYMTAQLRVLNGRLIQEGRSAQLAARVYLFLREFPDPTSIKIIAAAAISPANEEDMQHHITLLPVAREDSLRQFRVVLIPGIETVHEACP